MESRCFTLDNSPESQRSVDNHPNGPQKPSEGTPRFGRWERVPRPALDRSWMILRPARGYLRTVPLEKARDGGVSVGRLKRRSQNRIPAPNRTSKSRTCARRNHREPIERSTPTPTCGKIPKRMLAGSSAHGRAPVKSTRNRCMGTGGVSITGWPSARQARLARCANRIPRSRCGVPARILGQAPVRRHSTNLFHLGTPKGSLYDDFLSS